MTRRRYILSPLAQNDLRDIRRYIGADQPGEASAALTEIRATFNTIADYPDHGHLRTDIRDDDHVRYRTTTRGFTIIYLPSRPPVIARVAGRGQDLASLLPPE